MAFRNIQNNPYSRNNGKQQQQESVPQQEVTENIRGWADFYESNPEYSTVMYGTLTIPEELISQAIEEGHTKEVKGRNCVVLAIDVYEFGREWNFEGNPPVFEARIRMKGNKSSNGKFKQRQGQRRRF